MSAKQTNNSDRQRPFTLAVDIGGTGIKVMVLDAGGEPVGERQALPTPHPALPQAVLTEIVKLAEGQPAYDRVSVGFPGVVRDGVTQTAPNLDPAWQGFSLQTVLQERLGKPVRVANDADVQGFGAIAGRGIELVLTLGTGLGSALFVDGILVPNLELAHHPFRKEKTYEQMLGKKALQSAGRKKWRRRLDRAIELLERTINYDSLYLGGGNAKKLEPKELPENVHIVPNVAGLLGGIALWNAVYGTRLARAPHAPGAYSVLPTAQVQK